MTFLNTATPLCYFWYISPCACVCVSDVYCTQKFHFKKKKSYLTEFFFLKKARIHPYVKVTNRNKSTIPETTMLKNPETVLVKNTLKKNWKSIYPPTSSSNSSIKNEKNNPVYVENHFIFLLLFSDDQPFRIDANFSVKKSNSVDFYFVRHFSIPLNGQWAFVSILSYRYYEKGKKEV